MIVTVTLNAALDRTLTVPNFQLGQRHRASEVLTLAGGKGINVARALKRLDVPVVATGLAGGRTGTRIVEELTAEAILNDFVRIGEESRTSTAVVDPTEGSYSEINEWGPKVTPAELETLLEKVSYLSRGADFVVFAGTLPRGVDEGFYAEAVRDLNRRGVQVVLDSEGQPLRLGTEAEPWLVSPNQREAEHVVGQELEEEEDFLMALDAIAELGARNVQITLETGCYALFREDRQVRRLKAQAPTVEAVSVVGAGDVLVAQFIVAHLAGNFLIYVPADDYKAYNDYAHAIHANPALPALEIGLLVVFLAHVVLTIAMVVQNRKARPQGYAVKRSKRGRSGATAHNVMHWTGFVVLGFVVLHLMDFRFRVRFPEQPGVSPAERAIHILLDPVSGTVYTVGSLLLGYHLYHGLKSAFESLGASNERLRPRLRVASIAFAVIIAVGFASFPVWAQLFMK